MYYCNDCESEFKIYKTIYEKHNLDEPPYEKSYLCPFCGGNNIKEIEFTHCRCCGRRITKTDKKYCSDECERKGERLWKLQNKRIKLEKANPLNVILRELNDYNKVNNSNFSYGQYVALILFNKRKKR